MHTYVDNLVYKVASFFRSFNILRGDGHANERRWFRQVEVLVDTWKGVYGVWKLADDISYRTRVGMYCSY